ncbi:MAG: LysM peptidoglycan-binding domain-containing protein [Symploca sp. SIO3C6]|uniref:LysM peptidoglycan-binding domain-containing protein n=1 Tax=Symploca sp. SIO1C4 TaxID=2607765 RepID=A0A6B3NEY9_9CYAN|nr:LysM peptidoglycan-binding domain-containing protein [Symploca sp. SIO3C6]NER30180.1 LysM peptidoglycan-binding domain-containing protein [Symploca sp. SIO1C4]
MALEKLRIQPLSPSQLAEITVLFNPQSYSISKSVTWSPPQTSNSESTQTDRKVNAPTLTFGGGGSRQLTLDLFFDVTEPINGQKIDDVRRETDKIVALTRIERDLQRPPACEISWGDAPTTSDFPFTGVISSLTQKFTLFKSDGKPIRANLSVTFIEFLDPEQDKRQTDPEFTSRIIKQGDTLSSIAAEVYHNPKLWRIIAQANQIDNPRQVETEIGLRLTIPKLS